MLWLTTTIVSMPAWADRRTGGPAESRSSAMPTARPPDRLAAALFDRVNALVQRVRDVPGGVIPLRKVQRRAPATRSASRACRRGARLDRIPQAGTASRRGVPRRRCTRTSRQGVKRVPSSLGFYLTLGHGPACLCAAAASARARGGCADQPVRAAFSVSPNITEACGRRMVTEFRRFVLYARGSGGGGHEDLG